MRAHTWHACEYTHKVKTTLLGKNLVESYKRKKETKVIFGQRNVKESQHDRECR